MEIDRIIALAASLAGALSAIAALWTVREMQKQRRASFQPDLALSGASVECVVPQGAQSGSIPSHWKVPNEEDDPNQRGFTLALQNVGVATAKRVTVTYEFHIGNVVAIAKDLAARGNTEVAISFDGKVLSIGQPKNSVFVMWSAGLQAHFDYVLPLAHAPVGCTRLRLPFGYTEAISALFFLAANVKDERIEFPQIPPLQARIEFFDIAGRRYEENLHISFVVHMMQDGASKLAGRIEVERLYSR